MLGDALVKVAREFADSSQQPFKDNSLAIFIRQEWPQIVSQAIGHLQNNYKIVASPGKGRWSEAPWLALLDPIVCDSPEYGYYPVYLFSPDWSSVYLTMGQGTTAIRREFSKKEAVMVLRQQGELLRARVPEFSKNFSVGPFDLGATEQKKDVWASGPAWGTSYQVDRMPEEAKLKADLLEMLHLYQLANYRGGTAAVEEAAQDDNEDNSKPEIDGVRLTRPL